MSGEIKLLRKPAVLERTGMSKSTLDRKMKAGQFPRPVKLAGTRLVAWRSDDIARWIESQPIQQETEK